MKCDRIRESWAFEKNMIRFMIYNLIVFYAVHITGTISIAQIAARDRAVTADSPGASAAGHLAWDYESWKAIDIRVRQDIIDHQGGREYKVEFNTVEEHYIELKSGERFCDVKYLMNSSYFRRETHYTNGQKSALVNYANNDENKQKSYQLNMTNFRNENKSDRVARPIPFLYNYVGKTPLQEALAKAKYLGKDRVNGRDCDVFLFPGVKWPSIQDQVFFIDTASHIPIRVAGYKDQKSRGEDDPYWVWTADQLETIQGHVIPVKSSQNEYTSPGKKMSFARNFTILSIRFDGDYPPAMFWPELQPGVPTMDREAKKVFKTPSKQESSPPQSGPKAIIPRQEIVASPPIDGANMVSRAMLVIGAVIVVVVGFLLYRRRAWAARGHS